MRKIRKLRLLAKNFKDVKSHLRAWSALIASQELNISIKSSKEVILQRRFPLSKQSSAMDKNNKKRCKISLLV